MSKDELKSEKETEVKPESSCRWCVQQDCWLNVPDSVLKCKGKCCSYERT